MQKKNATVHLLILDPSQNDAESMVSLLRNSGRATRAHRITSEEDLEDALKSANWDLMLARDVAQEFGPDEALATLKRMDKDVPFVLLTEEPDLDRTAEILRAGAQDALPFDNKELLVLVARRELAALEERRRRRVLESHLREAEQRCQLLLESSKDAIAYINDGMHIYANQSYMEFLGYDDIDELICIPVLDTLSSESQSQYREFMKSFAEDGTDGMAMNCTARRSDDQELAVTMSVSAATYDGETCTQIVLQPEHNDAELEEKLKQLKSQDLVTGLFNRQYLMDTLAQTIAEAGKSNQTGALAYIALDNFQSVKQQAGIAGTDLLLGDVATLLKSNTGEGITLARLSDDAFCMMCMPCDDKGMAMMAEGVCKAIDDHLFDINGRTVPLTVSVGVAAITENSPKAEELIARAHVAADDVRKMAGHEHGNGVKVYNPADYHTAEQGNSAEAVLAAMEDGRFRVMYQPVMNLRGEDHEHYEVTLLMADKDNNQVSPFDRLPPVGREEAAIKIDRWVLLQTIKQLAAHRASGHDTRLFLNVSAETVQDKTFMPWLSVALKAARLPGDALIFQIREGDANNHMKQAKDFTKAVHQLHCKVSISQFGCALDPYNTLKHIETDYVRLDASFTEEVDKGDAGKEQLKELIKGLQNAGKITIVPEVQQAQVLAVLYQAGANFIQGSYLQPPSPAMNFDFGAN